MDSIIMIDALTVSMLIGVVLPIVVGIITKLGAPRGLQSVLLLFLASVLGLIVNATITNGTAVFSVEAILTAGIGWVTAIASHYGLLKPTGITPKVAEKTADFGLPIHPK